MTEFAGKARSTDDDPTMRHESVLEAFSGDTPVYYGVDSGESDPTVYSGLKRLPGSMAERWLE
jgi:hypothetical protein